MCMQVCFASKIIIFTHPSLSNTNSFSNYKGLGTCGVHVSRGDRGVFSGAQGQQCEPGD